MPELILTAEQQELLKTKAAATENWSDAEDLQLRNRISAETWRVIEDAGLPTGKNIDHKRFCELVGLLWKVQNLNPMQMPKLLGLYHYKVYFSDYMGTEADLAAERMKETGSPEFYPGPDLAELSEALRLLAADSNVEHGRGATQFYKIPGAGQALISGFLCLLHPDRYGIVNQPTKSPFDQDGLLAVSTEQRKAAHDRAKASFPNASDMSHDALYRIFRWEVFLQEASQITGITDFLELDLILWSLSVESPTEESEARLQAALEVINPKDIETRQKAEQEARNLIEAKLGRFNEQDFRSLFEKLNTCYSRKGVVYNRFAPAFVGQNANLLISKPEESNRVINDLWQASDEDVPALLTRIWDSDLRGGGRIFPTAILYLKNSEKYAVWTNFLENALYRVIRGLPGKYKTGFSYLQYCKGVQQLRKKGGFPPQMHDAVLSRIKTKPEPGAGSTSEGAFRGFTHDAFQFMQELAENNSQQWFDNHRIRFKESVDQPLRNLVKDVGEKVITQLDPNLETAAKSNKCLSRIRKNIYGKATENAYYEWYWAAFYRKDRKKQNDCQLYVTVVPEGFCYGLCIPEGAADIKKQLDKRLQEYSDLGQRIFDQIKQEGFVFTDTNEIDPVEVNDYQDFVALTRKKQFTVFRKLDPQQAVDQKQSLVETVGETFRTLYPLYQLATSAHPEALDLGSTNGEDDTDLDEITITHLTEKTLLEEEFFEKLDRLLDNKRQLVFCGPPGTSKTYVALEYAEYLAQNGGEVRTVQFHPSYGYEDFIEGLRPVSAENGSLSYQVEDGIFKRLCNAARSNPKQKCVLIIDEINRGNIPRIFGELLFLLERREKKVDLPYSKKSFSIPQNVILLGTMNSSDRSIALMDLALRRRFHFVKMEPRADILKTWLQENGKPIHVHRLFERLNDNLRKVGIEADRLVGHAHFMSVDLDEDSLQLIWEGSIGPMLEEYFIADPDKLNEFQFDNLLSIVEEQLNEPDETEDEEESDDTPSANSISEETA